MKHRGMTNNEVAHTWAHPRAENDHGRSRSMFFEGDVIYSYGRHFPIARIVTNERGEKAVLLTTARRSVTTTQHTTIAWRACRHLSVFKVPYVGDDYASRHRDNMRSYQAEYARFLVKAGCVSPAGSGPYWYVAAAGRVQQEANDYAAFFGLPERIEEDRATISAVHARWGRLNSPGAAAKREREREKREERQRRKSAAEIDAWARGIGPYRAKVAELATAEQRAQRDAIEYERSREKIEAWQRGESVYFGYASRVPCLLRVKGDLIETSWGARFPVEDGERAFAFIRLVRERGQAWLGQTNGGQPIKLANYQIDRIAADGTVRAGCHTVAWSEIERIARQLGLI